MFFVTLVLFRSLACCHPRISYVYMFHHFLTAVFSITPSSTSRPYRPYFTVLLPSFNDGCAACPVGRFAPSYGSHTNCSACSIGRYEGTGTPRVSCVDQTCAPGEKATKEEATTPTEGCTKCPGDTFQTLGGHRSECLRCARGKHGNTPLGASFCTVHACAADKSLELPAQRHAACCCKEWRTAGGKPISPGCEARRLSCNPNCVEPCVTGCCALTSACRYYTGGTGNVESGGVGGPPWRLESDKYWNVGCP